MPQPLHRTVLATDRVRHAISAALYSIGAPEASRRALGASIERFARAAALDAGALRDAPALYPDPADPGWYRALEDHVDRVLCTTDRVSVRIREWERGLRGEAPRLFRLHERAAGGWMMLFRVYRGTALASRLLAAGIDPEAEDPRSLEERLQVLARHNPWRRGRGLPPRPAHIGGPPIGAPAEAFAGDLCEVARQVGARVYGSFARARTWADPWESPAEVVRLRRMPPQHSV